MVLWVLGLIYTSFELSWHQHRALYIATANYWVEFTEHQQQISLSQGQIGMYGQGHVGNTSKKLHVPKLPPSSDRHLNKDFKKWTKISVLSFSFFMASDEISKCFLRTTCSIGKYGTEDCLCWNWLVFTLALLFASWMTLSCNRKLLSLDFFQLWYIGNFASFWDLSEIINTKYLS